MKRTAGWAGVALFISLGWCVANVRAQQPMGAEPPAPSRAVQKPAELVPPLPVPRLMKLAGTLKDEQGKARIGVVGVTFAVYKEQEGGAALWVETQNVELDEQGRYTVLLGSTRSEGLPLELFSSGEPRWLGVQVNLPKEMEQPRVLLVSVPYALKASDADTLGGKPLSSFVLANPTLERGGGGAALLNSATGPAGSATIGGGGTQNFVTKFDATGANVINSGISDNGTRINAGEGIDFSSDFSFVGNAEPAATGRVQMFDRAFVGFVVRGLNVLFETLQGNPAVPVEAMRVTESGNVGIGTSAPGQRLEVAGNLKISGNGNAIVFSDGTVQSTAGSGTVTGVTAGTGLTGGGTSGGVSLAINPAVVPQLGAVSNTFAGDIAAASFTGSGAGLTNVNPAVGSSNYIQNGTSAQPANFSISGNGSIGGNLALPNTTSSSVGVITLGTSPFLHNFGTNDTFVGASAGNMTMTSPGNNTAVGSTALTANTTGKGQSAFGTAALAATTSGTQNSAFGSAALTGNTTGNQNAAFGNSALFANTSGNTNSAFGTGALLANTTANLNAAFGFEALVANTTGGNNTAIGEGALFSLNGGANNIALGALAGSSLTSTESNNIYIGNLGVAGESQAIRIGTNPTATFIAGISGRTSASGVTVFIDTAGQLGTITSSRRFKDDISDVGEESDLLMKLRPVAFYYRPELDATHTRQYGLVAEEVAQVAPQLVVFDKDGAPETVRYHFVNAMLLNEVQKQKSTITQQQAEIKELAARLARLETLLASRP